MQTMQNHRYLSKVIPVTVLSLVLLCLCSHLQSVEAGGKGKGGRQGHIIIQNEVRDRNPGPIYMPIPIPIPMPMGPTGGGGKFHHQHDDEGEIKKIYLLQPMPKVQPQPHLKGGGLIGPVQTHIHMQPPVQHHSPPKRQHASHDGDSGSSSDHQHDSHRSGKSHSDLKILPIVVIPPMAPMPPIQVAPGQSIQHAPRMSLSPHFHNYLVTGSESSKKQYPVSHISLLQDHKSFSDYGGSTGGALYRERVADPKRMGRRALAGKVSEYSGQGTRARSVVFDDYGDNDYDGQQGPYSRRSQSRDRPTRYTGLTRRRSYQDHGRPQSRLSADSIRDIVEQQQQNLYDDDPYYEPSDQSESKSDCCNERRSSRASNYSPPLEPPLDPVLSSSEMRDIEYSEGRRSPFRSQGHLSDSMRVDEMVGNELNPIDIQPNDQLSRPSSRWRSGSGRRLYLDSREVLNDDDEWRLDSVKSVTHASSVANAIINLSNSTTASKNDTNIITTTLMPIMDTQ